MSKHDLKGIDTGKVGNNKFVDYTFEDYQKDLGLTREGTIKELERGGYNIRDFVPVMPTVQRADNFLSKFGIPVPTPLGVQSLKVGLPSTSELEIDNRGLLVAKDRPKNLAGGLAGIADIFTGQLFDFDKRGGNPLYGLTGNNVSLQGYGQKFDGNYELPTSLKETLALQDKAKKEKESKDPVDNIPEIIKAEKDYEKEMAPFRRKGRILDSALEFLNYTLTSPKILSDLRRESDYVQNRLLQAELRKQSFPNAVQSRMLAGSTGFATEAEAIAKQQQAATELAKAGVRTPTATFSA